MAAKGSAAKSASGASMSKYDVEVEKRLQALEAPLADFAAEPFAAIFILISVLFINKTKR